VVVGLHGSAQAFRGEENAAQGLQRGVGARARLAHPRGERIHALPRARQVLVRIDQLRDEQRPLEEIDLAFGDETPEAGDDAFPAAHATASRLRAIATPSRRGTMTLEKSLLAKSRRLNSRIPSVAASRTEASTTRPDQSTLSARRKPPGRTRGAAAARAAGSP